jgi:hypothetical protein
MVADIMSRLPVAPFATALVVRHACLVLALLLALNGCSNQKIKTHPVVGKIVQSGGDVAILKGSTVELMQDGDSTIRSSGVIAQDGSYQLKTFREGEFLTGAPEGTYKARIILADESDEGVPKRKGNPIHPRYLDFEKSGLQVTVPSEDYTISLSSK